MANADFYYPQSGKPQTVQFDITGRRPVSEEVQALTSVSFEKKPVSTEEVKDALKWFFIGILTAVFLWFFGRWVISKFVGPGVIFFGYGGAYLGAPVMLIFGFSSLFKLFRSGRKKKAEDSFKWVWEVSFLGDDAVAKRFGKLQYALDTLARAVPESITFNRTIIEKYITELRQTMVQAMDETTLPAREEHPGGWSEAGALKSTTINSVNEIFPGISEVSATITYQDVISRQDANNKSYKVIAAILELNITNVFIKAGEYYYPFDLTPSISRRNAPMNIASNE
ncbi:MAG: hypothetical protein GX625_04350 [Clostridiaceae bacterium]|nr:hypothetical protein [Clostridiaceae bacterium]